MNKELLRTLLQELIQNKNMQAELTLREYMLEHLRGLMGIDLCEGRVDHAASTYEKKLLSALNADSSAKNKEMTALEIVQKLADDVDPTKEKSHIVWVTRMYANGIFRFEDATDIKSNLELFAKVKSKLENKDLNSYKKISDLRAAVKPFKDAPESELMSKGEKLKHTKTVSDAEVFLEEPDFKVIIPKTYAASCEYGADTEWCTKKSADTFETYTAKGPLFIIHAKPNGKDRKFQLHYEEDQFMDEDDNRVGKKEIDALSALPGYTKFINKLIKKHYHPHILDEA